MRTVSPYYTVVIKSRYDKHDLMSFEHEDEAIDWCNDNHWMYAVEEGGFVWDLDIEKRDDEIDFFDDEDFDLDPEDEEDFDPTDSYRPHSTILKAMNAAGWDFDDLASHDEWLWFHGNYGFSMSFDSWREAEQWLLGVVFDDPDISDAVEQIMDEK